jgi:GNAT superfamily N-acetyltransferase
MMTDIQIRDLEPHDYARIAEIFHSIYPEYDFSADELRFEDESFDVGKYILRQHVAVEAGKVVAIGRYFRSPFTFHPQKFTMNIYVDPPRQRCGIGSMLYERIIEELRDLGAITVRTRTREDIVDSLSFLQKRGFSEKGRDWESRLRVREFAPSKFLHYLERATSQGIKITSLAEEVRLDPDCYKKLYELWFEKINPDSPFPDSYTLISFEEFMKQIINNPSLLPNGSFIAKLGKRYVGLSCSAKSEKEPRDLYQWITGVLREYRGHGIAVALKLRVIEFAAHEGYEVIKAWNDSTNAGMVAINQKLGFRRHVGWVGFEKSLKS